MLEKDEQIGYWNNVSKKYLESTTQIVSPFFNKETKQKFYNNVDKIRKDKEKSKTILDNGCGNGYFLDYLCKNRNKVHAIDFSSEMVKTATRNCKSKKLKAKIQEADFTMLPFEDNFFDEIFTINSFICPHRDDRILAFYESYRTLKEGGKFYGLFPSNENFQEQMYFLKEELCMDDMEENKALLETYEIMTERQYDPIGGFIDTPDDEMRIKVYSEFELKHSLSVLGFKKISLRKFRYPKSMTKDLEISIGKEDIYDWMVRAEK